ncbi:phytanoyl-CoA dioxygenase family protein [Candidatus Babeliales bacterium]|nr:phytanoyl-CoA dioxygenase family protein [Candidatus Babeliales bacterium]
MKLETLHFIRERYQRFPSLSYLFKKPSNSYVAQSVEVLKHEGIVKLSGLISAEELALLQRDFEVASKNQIDVRSSTDEFVSEYHDPRQKFYASENPFKYSETLVSICSNKTLNEVVDLYLRKKGYVHKAVSYRTLPGAEHGEGSSQWHHDAWGKRVNCMILLADIEEGDQYMTFIKGSHKIQHTFKEYAQSRLKPEYCNGKLPLIEIAKAQGKAGDIYLFDPNGLHSGNRTNGRTRDVFIVNYSSDKSYFWGMDFPQEVDLAAMNNKENPFKLLLDYKKANPNAGLLPKYYSWVDSLEHIKSWL